MSSLYGASFDQYVCKYLFINLAKKKKIILIYLLTMLIGKNS